MENTRVVVTHYGGLENIEVIQEKCPEPKPGEVRVKVIAAGVSLPDIMAREGRHPETPKTPYTPGWDLVGEVDKLGAGVSGFEIGQRVAALPIHGAYSKYVCLSQKELLAIPSDLDPAESVSLVLNYVTAYQMMHRTAHVNRGKSVLIHGAAGGVGTALMQLANEAGLKIYATCSSKDAKTITEMGGTPIDYEHTDFVEEIRRLTGDGVDFVFDPIAGPHLWKSRKALRKDGVVVGYGITPALRGKGLLSTRPGRRQRFRGVPRFALYIAGGFLLPGHKRVYPYSIQNLKRLKPTMFREDLTKLFELLQQKKIKPLVAKRMPLNEARQAQELLENKGVTGKIVLLVS